jgi:hypothetical protein
MTSNITKKQFMAISIFLFILVIFILKANHVSGLKPNEEYFFYTSQALNNGINTSRGYGDLLGVGPVLEKLFFNKMFYVIYFTFKTINWVFEGITALIIGLIN